jgi:hypothetical protein
MLHDVGKADHQQRRKTVRDGNISMPVRGLWRKCLGLSGEKHKGRPMNCTGTLPGSPVWGLEFDNLHSAPRIFRVWD